MRKPSYFGFIKTKYPNNETKIIITALTPLVPDAVPSLENIQNQLFIIRQDELTVQTEVPTPPNVIMVDKKYIHFEQLKESHAHPNNPNSTFVSTNFQTDKAEEWVLTPRFLKNIKSLP